MPEIQHGSIIAYRHWSLGWDTDTGSAVLLPVSYYVIYKWAYNVTEAKCMWSHDVPDWDCTCGIYALKELPSIKRDNPDLVNFPMIIIRGQVELFGKIIYHEQGYRAQYARVYSLSPYIRCAGCDMIKEKETYIDLNWEGTGLLPKVKGNRSFLPVCAPMCDKCISKYEADPKFRKVINKLTSMIFMATRMVEEEYIQEANIPLAFEEVCTRYCDGRRMLDIIL